MLTPQAAGGKSADIRRPGGKHGNNHMEHAVVSPAGANRNQRLESGRNQDRHAVNDSRLTESNRIVIKNQRAENHDGIDIVGDLVPIRARQEGRHSSEDKARHKKNHLAGKSQGLHNLHHGENAHHRHRNVQRERENIVENNDRGHKQDQNGRRYHSRFQQAILLQSAGCGLHTPTTRHSDLPDENPATEYP